MQSEVPGVHFWHVSMHFFHVFLSSHLPFFFSFLHFLDEILSLQSALWIDFSFSEIKTEQDKRYCNPKACNGQKIILGQKICQWICQKNCLKFVSFFIYLSLYTLMIYLVFYKYSFHKSVLLGNHYCCCIELWCLQLVLVLGFANLNLCSIIWCEY